MILRKFVLIMFCAVLLTGGAFAYQYATDPYSHPVKWRSIDIPVNYRIDDTGTPDCTGELTAIQSSYQSWENASGIDFNYAGTGSYVPTDWNQNDGVNVNVWCETNWTTVTGKGSGTIAVNATLYTYSPSTCYILDSDIIYNGEVYTWSSTGEGGKMDVQNIATHEFGHSLILLDLSGAGDSEKTMYYGASYGETKKRTLEQDDIDGALFLYPLSGTEDWELY